MLDHLDEYRSVYAACQAIGPSRCTGDEEWLRRAQKLAARAIDLAGNVRLSEGLFSGVAAIGTLVADLDQPER